MSERIAFAISVAALCMLIVAVGMLLGFGFTVGSDIAGGLLNISITVTE